MNDSVFVLGLLALGAVHGLNPAMGWLFAVGMGLQQRDRRAVWQALGPLAAGHALAIGAALLLAAALGLVLRPEWLEWLVAALLVGCGVVQLTRHVHPRGGMRMGARDLTLWSFLMASAHGAGLMALPLVLKAAAPLATSASHAHGAPHAAGAHAGHLLAAGVASTQALTLGATLVHTVGYLAVTGMLAVIVYEKLGLRLLRRAWLNLNLFWGIALVLTGVLTLLL